MCSHASPRGELNQIPFIPIANVDKAIFKINACAGHLTYEMKIWNTHSQATIYTISCLTNWQLTSCDIS